MHLVATNIILWIRTLVKETLDEIGEIEEEQVKSQLRMAAHHPVKSLFEIPPKLSGSLSPTKSGFVIMIRD